HALLAAGEARRTADRIDVATGQARGDEVRAALADARLEVRPCILEARGVGPHVGQTAAREQHCSAQGENTREHSHVTLPRLGSDRYDPAPSPLSSSPERT